MDTRHVKNGSVVRTKTQRRKPRVDNHYYVEDIARELSMKDATRCDNFIGAHDISAITRVTEMSPVGAVCSTMLYDELPSQYLHDCFNIEDVPRPEPEGMRVTTPTKTANGYASPMDNSSDMHICDRDSFTNITMLSDPLCPAPANSPNSSCSDDIPMENIVHIQSESHLMQLGPRPACIGQESDSDSFYLTGSSGYSSASGSFSRKPIPAHTSAYKDTIGAASVNENVHVQELKNKKSTPRLDITMCSDMTAFMEKPLCRHGVVKEAKMSRKQKKSIAHKLKNIGRKIHGITSSSSLQTLAVL